MSEELQLKKRSLDEFQILRDLGSGAYGKVILGRDKKTDKIVAIKSVNKDLIIQLDKKRHVYREKTLLQDMSHPFIIRLLTTMIVSNFTITLFLFCNRTMNASTSCLRTARTGLCLICAPKNVLTLVRNYFYKYIEKLPEDLVRQYAAQLVSVLEYL